MMFKKFGDSSILNNIYIDDDYEFRVEKIVALMDGKIVEAIENPKFDLLYFLINVILAGNHECYILVDRDCTRWHEAVCIPPKNLLLRDRDENNLEFSVDDAESIKSAIEMFCVSPDEI